MERVNNQNINTSAKESLDLTSVRNLFRARVKSSSVLGTSDHILVIYDNQLIILFIILIFFIIYRYFQHEFYIGDWRIDIKFVTFWLE